MSNETSNKKQGLDVQATLDKHEFQKGNGIPWVQFIELGIAVEENGHNSVAKFGLTSYPDNWLRFAFGIGNAILFFIACNTIQELECAIDTMKRVYCVEQMNETYYLSTAKQNRDFNKQQG